VTTVVALVPEQPHEKRHAADLRRFFALWRELLGGEWVRASTLLRTPALRDRLPDPETGHRELGRLLAAAKERPQAPYRIESRWNSNTKALMWRVVDIKEKRYEQRETADLRRFFALWRELFGGEWVRASTALRMAILRECLADPETTPPGLGRVLAAAKERPEGPYRVESRWNSKAKAPEWRVTAVQENAGHPFAGTYVLALAGLSVHPGSPRPVFDDDVWDFSGLVGAHATMPPKLRIIQVTGINSPLWRTVAREYILARLAPTHPDVVVLPRAYRAPLSPSSLLLHVTRLTSWFNFLSDNGVSSLREVTQDHCDAYLETVSWSKKTPGVRLSTETVNQFVRGTQDLAAYSEFLSDGYRPGFRPWGRRQATEVAGHVHDPLNKVPPVPDDILRPLLAACLYLVDTVGPRLVAEVAKVRADPRNDATNPNRLSHARISQVRDLIARRRGERVPAPRAELSVVRKRVADGWPEDDPLVHLSWSFVCAEATGSVVANLKHGMELVRPELEQWVAECGTSPIWCRDAVPVARSDDGAMVPWSLPMLRAEIDSMVYAVQSACFYLTSALSGMRSSELYEIRAGGRRKENRPGGGSRYRVDSRKIKGEKFGGVEESWVLIEDVYQALGLAEDLTGAEPGALLFGKQSNASTARYNSLRRWVNGPAGQRLGLEPIPDGPVNPRALRRTLALAIAQRPHGLMAAKIQLKHISMATTEGYAGVPGGHQAKFMAEVAEEEQEERTRLTVAAYEDYKRGIMPVGKGARDLVDTFQAADKILAEHAPGPVTVLDDRRVERIFKAKAKSLHLGVGNYCWFTDPSKALCLKIAGTPTADRPLMGMCDSARCPQATHHPQHRQPWADHAATTKTVFLGNPRISRLERQRAQDVYDRAMRIVTEIDNAHQDQEDAPDGK